MSEAAQRASLKVKLDVVKGPHAGKSFEFSKPQITLGRGVENDIVLMNDPQVSRQHVVVELIDQEFIVRNLSEKNTIYADGQIVQKWHLTNGSNFKIGDTDIHFTYDLGQVVRTIKPATSLQQVPVVKTTQTPKPLPDTGALKNRPLAPAGNKPNAVQKKEGLRSILKKSPNPHNGMNQTKMAQSTRSQDSSKTPFYILVSVVALALGFILLSPNSNNKVTKRKPAMRYEDEIEYNLRSEPEKKLEETLLHKFELSNSPQALRSQENFIRGMRDFQLGNYTRAMDNFQIVLNLDPEHALAKRYLYLSKVRFDELLQAKLMLGESNYQKHNFSMCESYYQQVVDMLQGQASNPKYVQATSMIRKCQLAQQGVR